MTIRPNFSTYNKIEDLPEDVLRQAKVLGFSDFQIARFVLKASGNMEKENLAVRARRKALNILPAVKRINTVASEHPELTNYLYMTYATTGYDVNYYKKRKIGSCIRFRRLPHRFIRGIRLVLCKCCPNRTQVGLQIHHD